MYHSVSPIKGRWPPDRVWIAFSDHAARFCIGFPNALHSTRVQLEIRRDILWFEPETELGDDLFCLGMEPLVGANEGGRVKGKLVVRIVLR